MPQIFNTLLSLCLRRIWKSCATAAVRASAALRCRITVISLNFLEVSKILYFWLSFIKSAVLNGVCLFSCSPGKIKWFLLIFKVSTHFQEVGWFLWSRQMNWFLLIFIKLVKLCSYGSFSCSLQNLMVFAFSWSQ